MTLYNGSGYNAHALPSKILSGQQALNTQAHQDFANYRIRWTSDVEGFFQKKINKLTLGGVKSVAKLDDDDDDEEEESNQHHLMFGDEGDCRKPIKKPLSH